MLDQEWEKIQQKIISILTQNGINKNQELEESQLKLLLDKWTKTGNFNDDLFEQLTSQIRKKNLMLNIQEFSGIWLQAEDRLIQGYEKNNREINEVKLERENAIEKLKNQKEKLNPKNIMENSTLTFKLKNAKNLSDENGNYIAGKFQFSFEGQSQETTFFSRQQEVDFDKLFIFSVEQAEEPLEIRLIQQSLSNKEIFFRLYLQDLMSQTTVDIEDENLFEYDIINKEENQSQITISFEAQWIYSKRKLLQDQINQIDIQLQQKTQILNSTKEYIEDLYSPFPELQKPIFSFNSEKIVQPIMITESTSVFEQNFETAPKDIDSNVYRVYLYSVYTFLILSFLENVYKPLLPDIFLGLLLFSSLQINLPRNLQSFSFKCIVCLCLLILLDIFWLIKHQRIWWNNQAINKEFHILKKLMVILSYVLMLNRGLIIYFINLTYKQNDTGDNEFLYIEE